MVALSEINTSEIRHQIWCEAENITKEDKSSDICTAVALLIASEIVGPNVKKCSKLLGVSRSNVAVLAKRLRENKVWDGRYVHHNWGGNHGGASLLLDGLVAMGLLERSG